MTARILDGRALAAELQEQLAVEVAALREQGIVPGLGVLLVGDDPASRSYVTAKEKACARVGIRSEEVHLPADADRGAILAVVRRFNRDPRIHGILVQFPLPDPSLQTEVILALDPAKDVDGFHPENVGRALLGLPAFLPCTPRGILKLLEAAQVETDGADVVVIGRSNLVGRPLANLLSRKGRPGNATVTLCHTRTRDLAYYTRHAHIVVAAAGVPGTVTAAHIRPGAVVIDVGVNRVPDPGAPRGYRLVGDVDFEGVREKAAAVTPVPGGVGPMTIAMLLENTVEAARRQAGLPPQAR